MWSSRLVSSYLPKYERTYVCFHILKCVFLQMSDWCYTDVRGRYTITVSCLRTSFKVAIFIDLAKKKTTDDGKTLIDQRDILSMKCQLISFVSLPF